MTKKESQKITKKTTNGYNKGDKQEAAYKFLKESILSNAYPPKYQLFDNELSVALGGMSRTPIRDALMKLSYEGLVDIYPGKGMFVSSASVEDVLEVSEIRLWIECGAVRLFIERATESLLEELERNIEQHKKAFEEGDIAKADQIDNEFHFIIAKGTMNSRVFPMLAQLVNEFIKGAYLKAQNEERIEKSINQHINIFNAIKNKDVEKAVDEMLKHSVDCVNYYKDIKMNQYYLFNI